MSIPNFCLGGATRKGHTVCLLIHHTWPGATVPFAWFPHRIISARVLSSGQRARVEQKGDRVWLHDLPEDWPDQYTPVIELTVEA